MAGDIVANLLPRRNRQERLMAAADATKMHGLMITLSIRCK
jgi:hypothetical protein